MQSKNTWNFFILDSQHRLVYEDLSFRTIASPLWICLLGRIASGVSPETLSFHQKFSPWSFNTKKPASPKKAAATPYTLASLAWNHSTSSNLPPLQPKVQNPKFSSSCRRHFIFRFPCRNPKYLPAGTQLGLVIAHAPSTVAAEVMGFCGVKIYLYYVLNLACKCVFQNEMNIPLSSIYIGHRRLPPGEHLRNQ